MPTPSSTTARRTASSPSTATRTPRPSSIREPGTRITNIPLGGKPEYGASAGDGKVYANLTDTSEVVEIDAKTPTVTRRWSTAPCKQPVAMAIDTVHHRLFSGCRSGVMAVSDYQAGKVVATVPIGAGVDGAGYDAASGDAFASNADGTLTVDSSGRRRTSITWPRRCRPPGVAQHGARSHQPSHLHRGREIWTGAGGRPGPRRGAAGIVHAAGGREGIALARFTGRDSPWDARRNHFQFPGPTLARSRPSRVGRAARRAHRTMRRTPASSRHSVD